MYKKLDAQNFRGGLSRQPPDRLTPPAPTVKAKVGP